MDNQSAPPSSTPPPGPTIPETPPPPPPTSASEPVPPKVQQHLESVPHANEPIKPHHTKKFWSAIIGTILLIVIASAALSWYLFFGPKAATAPENTQVVAPIVTSAPTPTPDPTADWKVFEGSNYFIKYPTTYYTKDAGASNAEGVNFSSLPYPTGNIEQAYLEKIKFWPGVLVSTEKGQTLEKIAVDSERFDSREGYSKEDVMVDGVPGLKVTQTGIDFPTDGVHVILNDKHYFIFISYVTQELDDSTKMEAMKIFEQMVSSFRFKTKSSSINAEGTVTPVP